MMNIGIGGSQGRMGQAILAEIAADSALDLNPVLKFNRTYTLREGLKTESIAVLIDFTVPEAAMDHVQICVAQGIPLVLGVTGFSTDQKTYIYQAAKHIPIVFSPNMSIGVNAMFSLLGSAAKIIDSLKERGIVVDSAIQETHHKHKKDAPSGTALRMGEIVCVDNYASIRVGDVPGDHKVIFALAGESIEIQHHAQNRTILAKGALTAAKWIINKQTPGLYDMQDVLGLRTKEGCI